MEIIKADMTHSNVIGNIHSKAWVQTYKDLFPIEYLRQESAQRREKEFIDNQKENIHYYLVVENGISIGFFKIVIVDDICELSSIYFLKEYCHKGYGTACMNYIKDIYFQYKIVLWTLEINQNARDFYEKNDFHDTGKRRVIYRGQDYVQLQYACCL